jgi:hypothetical protein
MKALLQEIVRTLPPRRSPMFYNGDYGVYREENFMELLAFEKRRSARSRRPFLLMTLTIAGISELQSRRDTIRGAVEALTVFSRETDIKGWYKRSSILGVIFTETADINTDRLHEKLYQRLHALLTGEQVNAIRISFHAYPDDGDSAVQDRPAGFMFDHDRFDNERSQKKASAV